MFWRNLKKKPVKIAEQNVFFWCGFCWGVDGKFWKEGIYLGIGLYSWAAEDCMKENLQVKCVLFVIMRYELISIDLVLKHTSKFSPCHWLHAYWFHIYEL
jgi:hypothetical protein